MRIPQVSDRMKEAPVHALRATFAGIGQLLLAADRLRSRSAAPGRTEPPAAGGSGKGAARPASRWRSLDETGNVRLLTRDELDEEIVDRARPTEPAAATQPAADPAPVAGTQRAQAADGTQPADGTQRAQAADGTRSPAAEALPVPNYDSLSLPSLRGRLRSLDAGQLRVLADYERAGRARLEVLTMFERRIAKLQAQG